MFNYKKSVNNFNITEEIKYLIRCKRTKNYIVDVEWDGTTYSKDPYFFKYYSFDTKEIAEKMKTANTEVVAIKEIKYIHTSHLEYKWHFTPKKKHTIRCSRCRLGTNNPRASFQIALTEFLKVTASKPCVSFIYEEIKI